VPVRRLDTAPVEDVKDDKEDDEDE
jgi:hypothetical protein